MQLPYLLSLPDDYDTTTDKYPLILFLHGSGERGNDLDRVKQHGLAQNVARGQNFPFIIIAPQCPLNANWEYYRPTLKKLIDDICQNYRVDTQRLYLTGLSMGGFGTWSLATDYPDLFAAIIPICGGPRRELDYPERLKAITHLPVWCFHGDADDIVPLEFSQTIIDNLTEYGGNPKLTIYPGVGHNSWTQTYNNPDIYEWLLSHRLDVEK